MKKYSPDYEMHEDRDGGWYHFEDVEKLIARADHLEHENAALAKIHADAVDARDAAGAKLAAVIAMLEPGSGQLGYVEDENTISLTIAEWNILEQAHSRAVALAEAQP